MDPSRSWSCRSPSNLNAIFQPVEDICDLKITRLDSPATPASHGAGRGGRGRIEQFACGLSLDRPAARRGNCSRRAVGSEAAAKGSRPLRLSYTSPTLVPFPGGRPRPASVYSGRTRTAASRPIPAQLSRGGRGSKGCLPSHQEQIRGKHARTTRGSTLWFGPGLT